MVIAGIVTVLLESAQYGGPGTVQPAGQLWESENPRAEESFNEREFLSRPSHNLSSLRGMNTTVITTSITVGIIPKQWRNCDGDEPKLRNSG
jgi:hypothetical protein